MCEKTRVEKTIVEAEKAVAEARRVVAQAKNKLAKPLRKRVYLAEGKINKYANASLRGLRQQCQNSAAQVAIQSS